MSLCFLRCPQWSRWNCSAERFRDERHLKLNHQSNQQVESYLKHTSKSLWIRSKNLSVHKTNLESCHAPHWREILMLGQVFFSGSGGEGCFQPEVCSDSSATAEDPHGCGKLRHSLHFPLPLRRLSIVCTNKYSGATANSFCLFV